MKELKHIKSFNEATENSKIPNEIQDEYNMLMFRLRDGSADPDIAEVEDRIEEIRKDYPNIHKVRH
jgi:hypothetical protein